jgi:hypothetical protein
VRFFLDEGPMPRIRTAKGAMHVGETVGGIGPWVAWSGWRRQSGQRSGKDRRERTHMMRIGSCPSGP